MQTEKERGGYSRSVIRLCGSFQINGTSAPDVIRDGKSALIKSVARDSAGVFTVTFNDYGTLPKRLISELATLSTKAAPTKMCVASVVVDSYSQSTRSFKIVTIQMSGTEAVTDPDDNDRVNFELVGSLSSAGTDAA